MASPNPSESSPLLPKPQNSEVSSRSDTLVERIEDGQPLSNDLQKDLPVERTPAQIAAIAVPLAVGVFLAAMDNTIVAASYATIASELNGLQISSWLATGYMLSNTAFQPLYGKLSDIFGRRALLILCYTLFAIGCLWCGSARNMTELILARTFAGIGGGGMTTLSSIVMSDIVPLRTRGVWQGLMNISFAAGQAAGAPLGGFFADSVGWRWSFYFQIPIAIIAILAVGFALKLPHTTEGTLGQKFKRIDFGGAITLIIAVASILLALDRGGNVSWTDKITLSMLAVFIFSFLAFCFVELEFAAEPFAPKRIIASRALIFSYLANFFGLASAIVVAFYIPYYLQAVNKMSPSKTGQWLLPGIAAGVSGSLWGGVVMKRTGKFWGVTVAGAMIQAFGTLLVATMTGSWMHIFAMVILGQAFNHFGNGSVITTSLISIIANAGPADQAMATAVSYLFRSLGMVLGISIGGTLLQDVLRSDLRRRLQGEDIDMIVTKVRESLAYLDELDPATQAVVRGSYEKGLSATFWFSFGMSVATAFMTLFIKEVPLNPQKPD